MVSVMETKILGEMGRRTKEVDDTNEDEQKLHQGRFTRHYADQGICYWKSRRINSLPQRMKILSRKEKKK